MTSILNKYIRRQVIFSTLLMGLIVLGIESFLVFVAQLSDIGVSNYDIFKSFIFVPLQLPTLLYQLFPMIGFLGSLMGLGKLAASSELIVMRASGVSIHQIGLSVIKTAVMMMIVVTFIGEWVGPILQAKSNNMKQSAMGHATGLSAMNGIWIHQGDSFVNIDSVLSATQIQGITLYQFADKNRLLAAKLADNGVLVNKKWQLSNVAQTDLSQENSVSSQKTTSESLALMFNPKLMYQTKQDCGTQSIKDLFHTIFYLKKTGLLTSQFEFAFWQRILQPFTTIVMIVLGLPFIFGTLRNSTTGSRVLMGVIIGFVFYMLNQFLGPFTLVYQFPPFLAASLPTFLFLLIYLLLIRRVNS